MPTPILATKLFIPPPRPKVVRRPRLIERLNEGLHGKLTLISAPAGFGKTTLVSAWIEEIRNTKYEMRDALVEVKAIVPATEGHNPKSTIQNRAVAWLSLDEGDSDPTRFLAYLVAALQTIVAKLGEGVLGLLQSPQPPREPTG